MFHPMHVLAFILMSIAATLVPFPYFILLAVVYVLRFGGTELLILTVCIDTSFGTLLGEAHYLYTLSFGAILILGVLTKPFLKFYTT